MPPRRLGLWLLALCLGLAAAVAVVAARRVAITERTLRWLAASRGIAPLSLRVTRVAPGALELRDLALGERDAPDLAIERLDAAWSIRSIVAARLDALEASGVRLRGALDGKGLHFGALDPLLRGGGSASGVALPAPTLALRDARARIDTPQGTAELSLEGALREAQDGRLAGDFTLRLEHPLLLASGTLRLEGTPDELGFRAALDGEKKLRGRLEARGRLLRGGSFEARVALRDVAFETQLARVSGLNGAIALGGPPLRTPPGQLLSMALLDPGVALSDGLIEWQLREDGALAVRRATWHWAGGTLGAEDLVFASRAGGDRAVLQVRDIDLANLLAQAKIAGLEGSGSIDGEVPLVRRGSAIQVLGGALRAPGGGILRYRPSGATQALADSRPNDLGLALSALSDFRYEKLEARLDGDLAGEMKIAVALRGANPAFQDGRPVELNLNLEARLADLVRSGLASYRVPEAVEERLRSFSGGEER